MSLRAACIALLLPLCAAASVQGADRPFVDAAWVNVADTGLEVNARVVYAEDERMSAALADGATVHLDLQVGVARKSRYWFDADVVEATLRRALSWNPLTLRFELKDDAELRSFDSLQEALDAAGIVDAWSVALREPLDPEARYRVRVRATARRGNLGSSLKALLPWSDDGIQHSEWSTWTLPR
ncbi:MAG: DUF4390 domain-containing protein [Pseudomonadota bacterium]|nr:DUF4390 domain-containing protein [Pseudomonadota bacterium]